MSPDMPASQAAVGIGLAGPPGHRVSVDAVAESGGFSCVRRPPSVGVRLGLEAVASSEAVPTGGVLPSLSPFPALGVGSRTGSTVPLLPAYGVCRGCFRPSRRARAWVERHGGRLLRLMKEKDRYDAFGFVRFGDYVVEHLGISSRTAQEMMRVDGALDSLPLVADAFESGDISTGHVRVLASVATSQNEVLWVGVARGMGVKALARTVASHMKQEGGAGPAGAEASAGDVGAQGGTAVQDGSEDGFLAADESGLEGAELQRVEIVAPAWIGGLWRDSVTFVRRLVGSLLPPGGCFEMVLSEVADAVEPLGTEEARRGSGEVYESACPGSGGPEELSTAGDSREVQRSAQRRLRDASALAGHSSALDVTKSGEDEEVHASARRAKDDGRAPSDEQAPGGSAPDSGLDACAIDRELRALFTERQRQDLLLADHLRLVALDRGYRDHGHASLEEYAADRFGLSHGALYNLLALNRRLEALPALRAAFLAGRVRARQASLIGSVATVLSVEAWIRRAEMVSVRRLEDEVSYERHLRESRPEVWDRLDGAPLPEGIVLEPGQAPRLQESAPPEGSQAHRVLAARGSAGPVSDGEVHASARDQDGLSGSGAPDAGVGATGVHASACAVDGHPAARRPATLSAEAFLQALAEDEQATPLPDRMCVIRLWLEPGVFKMWEATLAHLRTTFRADLKECEALALVLREFWSVWNNMETQRQRRENPILEMHGWRCAVPGCRSLGTGRLHLHHIIPRSQGGTDDPSILAPTCAGHHLRLIHQGKVRCSGWAPDGIVWEMGCAPGRDPFEVFLGQTRIAGPVS